MAEMNGPVDLRVLVRAAWVEALDHDDFTDDESFFSVGGHSMLAMTMVRKLGRTLGRRIPVRTFFDHPSVAELAAVLTEEPQPEALELP